MNNENQNSLARGNNRIILGQASSVEIQNTAVTHQSELEEPFPALRSRRWNPKDDPENGYQMETDLVVTQDVLQAVDHHTRRYLEKEVGGFLLGNLYVCPNTDRKYVLIDQIWRARYAIGNEVSLRLTADTWADLADQMQTKFRGKLLAGWYHSHPRMSVFLSEDDLEIHAKRFDQPWMFALVVEPVSREGGFFGVCNGEVNPRRPLPFHEFFSHRAVYSVVDWNNYACAEIDDDHDEAAIEVINLPDPIRTHDSAAVADRLPVKPRSNRSTLLVPLLSILVTGASILGLYRQSILDWCNILSPRTVIPVPNLPSPVQTIPTPPIEELKGITSDTSGPAPNDNVRPSKERPRQPNGAGTNKKGQTPVTPPAKGKNVERGDNNGRRTAPSADKRAVNQTRNDADARASKENSKASKADPAKSPDSSGTSDFNKY